MKLIPAALPQTQAAPAGPSLEDIQQKRAIAALLAKEGQSSAPVQHWTQAAARVANAMMSSLNQSQAASEDARLRGEANDAIMGLLPSLTGGASPAGMPPQPVKNDAQDAIDMTPDQKGVYQVAQGLASPGFQAAVQARQPQMAANAPASIRNNNPGAMWPGPSSQKYGATGFQNIAGGNKIATFPDATSGAAAQFDLLNRKYAGMPLNAAIAKWSGGNSSPQYSARIAQATGISPNTVITPQMLQDPKFAVPFAKAMAQWETGKPYPLSDNQWADAHRMSLGGPQQTAQAQPQGIQVADASGQTVGGMDRAALAKMLANPYTKDFAEKLIMQRTKGASGADLPANIQEWNIYNKMSPEDQQRFIEMKRANKYLDLGTGFVNPSTGQTVQKDLQGAERLKKIGEAEGTATGSAPADIAVMDDALTLLDDIKNDPSLDIATGFSSYGNVIPGTPGYDFQQKVNQAKSGAFLTAIQKMRGMGSLSNAEGETATKAVTRMGTALSRDAFLAALADYERIVKRGRKKAEDMLAKYGNGQTPQAAPSGQGKVPKYNPQTGEFE